MIYAPVPLSEALADAEVFTDGDWVESKDQDPAGDVRLTQLADVGDGYWINKSARFLTSAKAKELRCTYLKPGDVLVARMPDPLGRSCIFPGDQMPCVTVVDVCVIRPNASKIVPRYLMHAINSRAGRHGINNYITGTTRQRISRSNLAKIEIPLPPLAEQKRIAGILDAADALRAKRREALAQLDSLLQANFLDLFGDPVTNPRFPCGPIRPFASANSGKSAKNVISNEETGIPIYGGNGVNGWATKALYEESVLVFGRVGQQCGNTFLTTGPAWVTDNAIVVTVNDAARLSDEYLLHAFRMTKFAERVKHLDLPFINQGIILDHPLCLPPLALQLTFTKHAAAIDQMRIAHRAHLAELDTLFASLQSRAFNGEL